MFLRKTLGLDACEIHIKGEGGALQFAGYASVFGGVDSYGDTILRGAFESSLRTTGKPKMFYGHTWDMPIGKYTHVKEDDKGLYVEGELTPGHSKAADVAAAMRHQTLDGLSIGGFVKQSDYDATSDGGRIIRKWSKLIEVSPVVFPADGAARIDLASVKAEDLAETLTSIGTVSDFQLFLCDTIGLTGPSADQLIQRAKTLFTQHDAGANTQKQHDELANALLIRRLRRVSGSLPTQP